MFGEKWRNFMRAADRKRSTWDFNHKWWNAAHGEGAPGARGWKMRHNKNGRIWKAKYAREHRQTSDKQNDGSGRRLKTSIFSFNEQIYANFGAEHHHSHLSFSVRVCVWADVSTHFTFSLCNQTQALCSQLNWVWLTVSTWIHARSSPCSRAHSAP